MTYTPRKAFGGKVPFDNKLHCRGGERPAGKAARSLRTGVAQDKHYNSLLRTPPAGMNLVYAEL